jgi:mannose-6-phosphate isomerase-like protein (cupin superfamily)
LEKLESRKVYMQLGHVTEKHYHTYWELLYFLSGAAVLTIHHATGYPHRLDFKAGDAIMIPAGYEHSLIYNQPTEILCIYGPLKPGETRGHLKH